MKQYILSIFLALMAFCHTFAQTTVLSYHRQVKPLKAVSRVTAFDSLKADEKREQVLYTDPIGRPMISIATRITPDKYDMQVYHDYDRLGRQAKVYLPYSSRIDSIRYSWTNDPFEPLNEPLPLYAPWENQIQRFELHQETFYDGFYAPTVSPNDAPYAETKYENSPKGRVIEQSAPGAAFKMNVSNAKTVKFNYRTNIDAEFWEWEVSNNNLECILKGEAVEYTGYVVERTDENGDIVAEFKDLNGRTIKTQKKLSTSKYLETYYVYNKLGQLCFVLPPEAINAARVLFNLSLPQALSQTLLEKWAFSYKYDERGRLVEKKLPGIAPIYYVYDTRDRLILAQDGKLRAANNKWSFIKYDAANRPIISGLYQHSILLNQKDMQIHIEGLTYTPFERRNNANYATLFGYTNTAFPEVTSTSVEILSVNYYDDYDFNYDGNADLVYQSSPEFPNQFAFNRLRGQATGNKVKVLGSSSTTPEWITSAVFYDEEGRLLQTYKKYSSDESEITTLKYDYEGKVLKSKSIHNRNSLLSITVRNRYIYDHAGRMLKLYKQVNEQTEVLLAQYTYNDLDQVITKNVHSRTEKVSPPANYKTSFLQEVNYKYNDRGWLTQINDADLSKSKDLFGFELNYVQTGPFNTVGQFNGNIASMAWQSRTDSVRRNYAYSYDKAGQLVKARYAAGNYINPSSILTEIDRYSMSGLTYDDNGNIKTLRRRGYLQSGTPVDPGSGGNSRFGNDPNAYYAVIDKLDYTYDGNQLTSVADSVTNHNVARLDFKNGTASQNADYNYDQNGSLTQDLNKNITGITYNVLNLPEEITFNSGNKLKFKYDATGKKLYQEMVTQSGSIVHKTTYRSLDTFENDTTGIIQTEEGRMVCNSQNFWQFEYHYTDHLGNVRLTYGEKEAEIGETLNLTLEEDTQEIIDEENATFKNFANIKDNEYYHSGSLSALVQTAGGPETSPCLEVKNGDKIAMHVWYFHKNPKTGWVDQAYAKKGNNLAQNLLKLAKPSVALGVGLIPLGPQNLYQSKNEAGGISKGYMPAAQLNIVGGLSYLWASSKTKPQSFSTRKVQTQLAASSEIGPEFLLTEAAEEPFQPVTRAYLAWELKNSSGTIIKQGQVQVQKMEAQNIANGKFQELRLDLEIDLKDVADTTASLNVKLVNLDGTQVWFDDLAIKHTRRDVAEIVQADHYDPFGLMLPDLSYRKPNEAVNKALFNAGSEWQKDLQWYSTFYRQYDPQLGRFQQFDPSAESYFSLTPYQYCGNNPISHNDPLGDKYYHMEAFIMGSGLSDGVVYGAGGGSANPFNGSYYSSGIGTQFMQNTYNNFVTTTNEKYDNRYGSGKAINQSLAETFGVFYFGQTKHQNVKYDPETGKVSMFTDFETSDTKNADGQSITYINYSPVGENFSLINMYLHFQVGGGSDYHINASSLDFSVTNQRQLGLDKIPKGESLDPVNLFEMGKTNHIALAFGRVTMTRVSDTQFTIASNPFDFYPIVDPGASLGRNLGNILGLMINHNLIPGIPISPVIPLIFGGPYNVYFNGTVTIPK